MYWEKKWWIEEEWQPLPGSRRKAGSALLFCCFSCLGWTQMMGLWWCMVAWHVVTQDWILTWLTHRWSFSGFTQLTRSSTDIQLFTSLLLLEDSIQTACQTKNMQRFQLKAHLNHLFGAKLLFYACQITIFFAFFMNRTKIMGENGVLSQQVANKVPKGTIQNWFFTKLLCGDNTAGARTGN